MSYFVISIIFTSIMSKRPRSKKAKQPEFSMTLFVSQNAQHKYSIIHNKNVISGRIVILADFDHLNLAEILRTSSLEFFVAIKEPVYLELVHYFYSNLSFHANHIRSRVKSIDIDISLENFTRLLHLSCKGVDIHNVNLHDFEYQDGETDLTASLASRRWEVGSSKERRGKVLHSHAQVLAKIVFYNLLPKSGEYCHAHGSAPLLIYCLLKDIIVNILKLIIDFMLSEHLLIPNRNIPFGMLITYLLKLLKFDLSGEKAIALSIDINSTLLKRMHVGNRASIPPSPVIPTFASRSSSASADPFAALSAQFQEHSLKINTQLEKISTRQDEFWQEYRKDLEHVCFSIRYLLSYVDESFGRHAWPAHLLSGYAELLGPPFDHGYLSQLHPEHQPLPKILISRLRKKKIELLFDADKKGESDGVI